MCGFGRSEVGFSRGSAFWLSPSVLTWPKAAVSGRKGLGMAVKEHKKFSKFRATAQAADVKALQQGACRALSVLPHFHKMMKKQEGDPP